jgi:dipeptidase D
MEWFENISRFPRCSKGEAAVSRWFQDWARRRGWPAKTDPAGNLLIDVPASPGAETAAGVVLQGHLDMVCEKTPESVHDFSRDPIRLIREGEWVRADGTTLGADNGVALALGAALAEDAALRHPKLELLFTVDEETGLTGAKALAPGFFEARTLVNLDSESEGVFTVGCAGGRDAVIRREVTFGTVPDGHLRVRFSVGGLLGGHSGIDIHRHRANAIRLLAQALQQLLTLQGLELIDIRGGSKRNAIPRDAQALLACPAGRMPELLGRTERLLALVRREYPAEAGVYFNVTPQGEAGGGLRALARQDAVGLVQLLLALPHGVCEMDSGFTDLVMSSNNLAVTRTTEGGQEIITSQRSLTAPGLDSVSGTVRAVAALAGARCTSESEYPPWAPNLDSAILRRCRRIYRSLYRRQPEVRALHAGLECAIIGSTYPGLDMISLGPTTENAHSPAERLNVPSLARLYDFLSALLESMAAG